MENKTIWLLGFGATLFVVIFIVFAKFLVPIVPLLAAGFLLLTRSKLKTTIFSKQKHLYELTEGTARLEGKAILREEGLSSYYFKEKCIGYHYIEEEYVSNYDGYSTTILAERTACKNFLLDTHHGAVSVNAKNIDLSDLPKTVKNEHSLKINVNDIGHIEHTLKHKDEVVIVGTLVKNTRGQLEFAKVGKDFFFATTKANVTGVKSSFDMLFRLSPWLLLMYLAVNYFLFFAPFVSVPESVLFPYFAIFGLPVIFVVLFFITKDKDDSFSKFLQLLASICILTSMLTFPLMLLFYSIKLEYYRIFCIFTSIALFTTLALIFNYKHLSNFNKRNP